MKKFILVYLVAFWLVLTSLAQGADPVGVIFFGDWGMGNSDQKKIAARIGNFCGKERCDFIAALGDNFYPRGVKSTKDEAWKTKWQDIYEPLKLQFRAALGNHDYQGNVDAQIQYTRESTNWYMPGKYYKYVAGNAEFFVIDTEKFTTEQAKWLKEALNASTAEWKIVYGHHPIYSYGMHGHTRPLITDLLPILRGKAHVYLSGHDHDLQVLKSDPSDPLFVVSGAAAETRPVEKGAKTIFAASQLGFGHLTIEEKRLRLRLVDEQGLPLHDQTL